MSKPTLIFKHRKYDTEIAHSHMPTYAAKLAESILGNIAIALAEPDGEDSAGRRQWRAMSPEAVAERAMAIAEHMTHGFLARGWLVEVPPKPAEPEPTTASGGPV